MAVYTEVPAEELAEFLAAYDVGTLVMAKGIAEGVSNSNYLVETTRGRFVLTLYERRIDEADLPWFLALMGHLAGRGLPVPRPLADAQGRTLSRLRGRPAALVEFLAGVSLTQPQAAHCRAVGEALARLHLAGRDFGPPRPNHLGPAAARAIANDLGDRLDRLEPGLRDRIRRTLDQVERDWPGRLPTGVIHGDLFPDNVLFQGGQVSGLIDFYFAATDLLAYDLAVARTAWSFTPDGRHFLPHHDAALLEGYAQVRPLAPDERAALPLLAQAACLRFLLTRAQDWFDPAPGFVQRKDPLAFARRLRHHAAPAPA